MTKVPAHRNAPHALTETTLRQGLRFLAKQDPDLARVLDQFGAPPMWARVPGFPTLIQIILEQQVSLASARAAFNRLTAAVSPLSLTPQAFLVLDDAALKTIGFSRQKTAYGRHLAEMILQRQLDLDALHAMDDAAVRSALLQIKGIGPWSADIYLLMALRRPDVWPTGDLALISAVQRVKRLVDRPTSDALSEMSLAWQPWRAVAARIFWHYYLSKGATT